MAGLPLSLPFANNFINNISGVSTPAVPPMEVIAAVVGRESIRKKRPQFGNTRGNWTSGNAFLPCNFQAVGETAAPPWFGPAMEVALRPLEQRLLKMEAIQTNEIRVFKHNRKALNDNWIVIMAPYKTIIGFSAAPPIAAMNPVGGVPDDIAGVLDGDASLPGVGEIPPASFPFPENFDSYLSPAHIGYLCRFYNDTFGVVEGDGNDAQNLKLQNFLLGIEN
eukprot:gene1681-3253_t